MHQKKLARARPQKDFICIESLIDYAAAPAFLLQLNLSDSKLKAYEGCGLVAARDHP